MKFKILKNIFVAIIFILSIPQNSCALSVVEISVPEQGVYANKQVVLPITLRASEQINAISFDFVVPQDMVVNSVNDGGSIVSFWIEKPVYNETTHHIYFSGIIPGGFVGKGVLANIIATPKHSDLYLISIQKAEVHKNNSNASIDEFSTGSMQIPVASADSNALPFFEPASDTQKPEHFEISVAQDESLLDGKWVALFNTQDKDSGIARYEVAETKNKIIDQDYSKLSWMPAESPYILTDQRLASYIYVKAIDNNSNIQIEERPPQYPVTWYDALVFEFGASFVIILLIGYAVWYLHRRKHIIKAKHAHRHHRHEHHKHD